MRQLTALNKLEEVEVIPGLGIRTGISSTTVGLLQTAAARQQTAGRRQPGNRQPGNGHQGKTVDRR